MAQTVEQRVDEWARADAERNGVVGDEVEGYVTAVRNSFAGASKAIQFAADDIKAELKPGLRRLVDWVDRASNR